METIGISPRFFTHELNNYSEWEKAFWRELIQNSVDEQSSRIEITVRGLLECEELQEVEDAEMALLCTQTTGACQKPARAALEVARTRLSLLQSRSKNIDSLCEIVFSDNGPGMSEDTMRNIYFQLGATGKEGADTIGGHGRARILTCFAHESYQIRTQRLLCTGHGGSFNINNTQPNFPGCEVQIILSAAKADNMESRLREYLSTCQLPCSVSINKIPFTEWLHRRKATRQLTFASVHTTRQRGYTALARVRGVTMFERYTNCKVGIIVEIDPAKSREILTVSRDQLKYESQCELNDFITEITIDHKSIERDCSINQTEIYGKFKKIGKKREGSISAPQEAPHATITGTSETRWHNGYAAAAYCINPCEPLLPPEPECPYQYSVHYEDAPKELRASAKRFHKENIAGTRLRLLLAWEETIKFFLETLHEEYGEEIAYLPGFAFGKGIGGLCKKEKYGDDEVGFILYINPLDSDGKINLSCQDYEKLYAIGAHEVSHVRSDYHGEEYAAVLTQLVQATIGRTNEYKARVKNALTAAKKTKPEENIDSQTGFQEMIEHGN